MVGVGMYGHHIYQSIDHPGKVANPARGQLNRGNEYSPVPVRVNGRKCSLFMLGASFCCRQFSRLCSGLTCQYCVHTEYGSINTCCIDVLLCIPRGAFHGMVVLTLK